MRIHGIVDYSYIYYKYKFQLDSGKMRKLRVLLNADGRLVEDNSTEDGIATLFYKAKEIKKIIECANMPMCNYSDSQIQVLKSELEGIQSKIDEYGVIVEKDISQIYYTIKEIEGFRQKLEQYGHEVTMSICFDMPSGRKDVSEEATDGENEAALEYKSKRVKRLGEEDFSNMGIVRELLSEAGHNVYRLDGTEADDLVADLIKNYKDKFDYTIMYTSDADLLANIGPGVGAQRFKATKGYSQVDKATFSQYLSAEYKCNVPYNSLMLYKCTVGDTSDNIKGIVKFGPKAFDKLVSYLDSKGVNWEEQGTYTKTLELLQLCRGYLSDDNIKQAMESLSLVRPMILEEGTLEEPNKISTKELRIKSYGKYNMKSLMV